LHHGLNITMTQHMHFRQRLFLILRYASVRDKTAALVFSWVMTLLVLANVVAVILESVPSIDHHYQQAFAWFDALSIFFFSIEYLLRVWTAADNHRSHLKTATGRRLHYMFGFHGLIDLVAILPFFLQSLMPGLDLRVLRVIRVLRILKLSHYSTALEDLIASIYAERDSFISALYLLALSILLASCLMYYAEHHVQPVQFGTIPDAMWWAIITVTTVGYGDAAPVTVYGKFIGALTALSGVFTVALLTGIVASAFATRVRRQEIEFTTEVEEIVKDGHIDSKERRTMEHLRKEFGITEEHARAIVRQVIKESSTGHHRQP
jgi:voltage-gated potassium channel